MDEQEFSEFRGDYYFRSYSISKSGDFPTVPILLQHTVELLLAYYCSVAKIEIKALFFDVFLAYSFGILVMDSEYVY